MAVDLDWSLLTNASANLGNALVQGAGQIRQRREAAKNRAAVANYLNNPNDQAAFAGLAERSPEMAFRIQDQHVERARQLTADQRAHLDYLGQILADERGQPIGPEAYPQALELARRAGIDVTGHEVYDPAFVGSVVQLRNRLHPVTPVSVPEGGTLVNPQTGAVVGQGRPPRPRYYPIQPGGRLELDPSYEGPTTDAPAPVPGPMASGEAPAFQPAPPGAPSQFSNVPSGNPLNPNLASQNQIVRVNTFEEAAALPPGTVFLMAGETTPRVRH